MDYEPDEMTGRKIAGGQASSDEVGHKEIGMESGRGSSGPAGLEETGDGRIEIRDPFRKLRNKAGRGSAVFFKARGCRWRGCMLRFGC